MSKGSMRLRALGALVGIAAIAVTAIAVTGASAKPAANPYHLNKEGTLTVGMTLQFKPQMYLNAKGQPVLVGTVSVEKSEKLSGILKKMGVPHEVLNAKNHEREASIVAQAGRKAAVTVSTNMAGRGTDILLGGNPEFMTKDACLKEKVAEKLNEDEAQYVADEHFYFFTHHDQFYRVRRSA